MNQLQTTIQDPNAPVKMPQDFPTPPEGANVNEEAELKLALSLIAKGKAARKKIDSNWPKLEAYFDGDQYYGKKLPSYRAKPVANKIRPAIMTILPIMTDSQPGVDVTPQEPSDYAFATGISEVVRSWWKRNSVSLTIVEVLMDALKLNGGIAKVVWDSDLESGRGDVHAVRIDPHNFYPADGAIDCNNNCPYTVEMYPARVGELKKRFPDKADQIRATGARDQQQKDAGGNGYSTDVILVSPIDKATGPFPEIGGTPSSDSDVVWVAEIWVDDESTEEIELEDGTKEERRKWPSGKIIQCVPDLNLLLTVDSNPYKDGRKPYVRFIDTIVPGEFWGDGEVAPYINTQDMINKALATIYDYLNSMTNPVWIVDRDSGVDPTKITNQIGMILLKNRGSEVRRESPPQLPAEVFNFYTLMNQQIDTENGVHEITQGRKPVGVTAAEAMNTMQEAAQTRIRLKERNMQASLDQLGFLIVSRILQFYRKPRLVKISGNQQFPEFFEFFIEDVPNTDRMRFMKQDYQYDDVAKQYVPSRDGYKAVGESKGMFDVQIQAGTSLPAAKAQRGNLALSLFDKKAIDQEALLDSLEWKDKEQIMTRMQKAAETQAQAAAQAAAQKTGQPQGVPA